MGGEGCEGEGEGNEFSECTEGGSDLSGKVGGDGRYIGRGNRGEEHEGERGGKGRCCHFYS